MPVSYKLNVIDKTIINHISKRSIVNGCKSESLMLCTYIPDKLQQEPLSRFDVQQSGIIVQ